MKLLYFSIFVALATAVLGADSKKIEIPGFSISTPPIGAGEGWWMAGTNPLEMSRYSLSDRSTNLPVVVTILRYANPQQAKKAFEFSWRSRPKAPDKMKASGWESAHKWETYHRLQDVFLLKSNYCVGVYDLPLDFSTRKTNKLFESLGNVIDKLEPKNAISE